MSSSNTWRVAESKNGLLWTDIDPPTMARGARGGLVEVRKDYYDTTPVPAALANKHGMTAKQNWSSRSDVCLPRTSAAISGFCRMHLGCDSRPPACLSSTPTFAMNAVVGFATVPPAPLGRE